MLPDASKMKQRAMMRRLPEMAQCIKLHFSKEKKAVMSLYKVAKLVSAGLQKNPVSDGRLTSHC